MKNECDSGGAPPVDGKVLRLHFACRAELPLGSSLRVTSSDSLSTTTSTLIGGGGGGVGSAGSNALQPTNSNYDTIEDDIGDAAERSSLYSSSVEMVTSPETYPLWRTRNPVIRVVNSAADEGGGIFRHRYRYLVVTPGDSKPAKDGIGMITSDGCGGVVEVDEWEDPFVDYLVDDVDTKQQHYQNHRYNTDLPYRTIEIDVSSVDPSTFGKVLSGPSLSSASSSSSSSSQGGGVNFSCKDVRIDNWNDKDDVAFIPYKAQMIKQPPNRQHSAAWTSESDSDAIFSDRDRTTTDSDAAAESKMQCDADNDTGTGTCTTAVKRIFLVCYHLPIILDHDPETGKFSASFSESLIAKTEQSGVSKSYDALWIGTVSADLKTEEEKNAVREVLKPMNCTPLFLDKSLTESFYYGMCKQVLWPAFHNIDLLDISKSGWGNKTLSDEPDSSNWDQSRLDVWWNAYRQVNRIFTETLTALLGPHDKVWVHDYHLSLLPKMLHEVQDSLNKERTIQMVYFLHIPFPTSQVFREIEHGGEILEGILHADVVGFHAFDHARHFLNASKRILGLSHESLVGGLIGVRYRGTKVLVTISNVSIETDVVERAMTSPLVSEGIDHFKSKYNGRQVICGVDIAQGLSGISLKLLAFERLLSDYPNWLGNVVLVQRNLIPSSRKSDELDTINHVRYLVNRLKKTFGPDVVDYEEIHASSLPIQQRLALWSSSDVFLSSPIREGLNLLPLEYVYTRKETPGVTMISEFSAMSSILNGALRVNPYDVKMASTIIDTALSMSIEEKVSRRERDIHFVSTSPSGQWTRNVLRDLNDVKLATEIDNKTTKRSMRATAKMEAVSPATIINSSLLDSATVTSAYNLSKKRVIFIDFNGTIVMKEPAGKYLKREMLGISGHKPPEETIEALTTLCSDKRNVVFVVSGDTESNIENAIGDIVGLGLAAGNGGTLSLPLKAGQTARKWEAIDLGIDWDAILVLAMPVLSKYTARANGSFVKHTSSSIGWSYYGCDPEWGEMLATQLVNELEVALHAFNVRIVKLKGVVEVVPRNLNKGRIVKRVLADHDADFILCMGDDVSDEKMFTSIFSVLAESQNQQTSHAFTVTVGKKASNASYYLENAQDVADLLVDMANLRRGLGGGRAMSWDRDDCTTDLFA